MAYLEIKNFCKSFGQTEVLNGIDLSVEKGEAVSVIGSSGSGKTTLLRCINFLEKPDKGVMILDGETLFDAETDKNEKESDLREKRLNFGLVFQSFNLFPQYNVLDNLTLAPLLLLKEKLDEQFKGKSRKQRKEIFNAEKEKVIAECTELLYKVGLSDKIKAYPCELSGGQCQRVAIARVNAAQVDRTRCPRWPMNFSRRGSASRRASQRLDAPHDALADEAAQLAKTADCAVVYLGLPERFSRPKGLHRAHMRPAGEPQIALMKKPRAVCKKMVAVLSCGSAVETDWAQGLRRAAFTRVWAAKRAARSALRSAPPAWPPRPA